MTGSSFVYVTYIRTTPDKLWSALTTPEFIKKYWFGIEHETNWKVGSPWKMTYPDGRVTDTGEIEAFDPPKRLAIKWRNEFMPELKAEGWSQCVMDIEPVGDSSESSPSPIRWSWKTQSSLAPFPAAGRKFSPTSNRFWRPARWC